MTLQEVKDNLLKEIMTPIGRMVLYGVNCAPHIDGMMLFFYHTGKRIEFFSIDCSVIN